MAPVTIMGHKVYGVFIEPGMGLRRNNTKGTAVDDQAEGQYWVINGQHFNAGCCFDYGNAEIDSRDDDNGTMETTYFGDATPWYHGNPPGPWVMTDQENNLVGCVNPDRSKLCPTLPNISWRFVTAIAKGEPHHWTSMGGNSAEGVLSVMFDGPRIDSTYDPMRKQGAILLGNGGDNSVGSQGTFYEGAMTAANTFPSDATDQLVQSNVVAAHYAVQAVSIAPASAKAMPPGLQTFTPSSSKDTTVTFTNTSKTPATGVELSVSVPSQWIAVVAGTKDISKTFEKPIAPGESVSSIFTVTSGAAAFNGDLIGKASWTGPSGNASIITAEKVRNVSSVKINEFRVGGGPSNPTNTFIELYNAGSDSVDISNWSLTEHPTQQTIFSAVKMPAGTKLAAGGFYVLGLATSGLSVPARAGAAAISVRSTTGMTVGDTIEIGTGKDAEIRKIASIGTAASSSTTLWQPLPDGPVITIPVSSTNVPVTSVAGFRVGEKIALGHGATYPAVGSGMERYEVSTVIAVGKAGTEALLAADAPAGATNLKVTSVANISVGDKIRLDIDSVGHGIEPVTVTKVGTQSTRTGLAANVSAGATRITVRAANLAVGDLLIVGTPANHETVAITAIDTAGPATAGGFGPAPVAVDFKPALTAAHSSGEYVINPGTGLDLAAPLRSNHAANLPFSDRGTGISFSPATAFAHSSNEPVQPLGTGITLDKPLANAHAIEAVVRDAAVTTAGYQEMPAPNQWFGGPALSASAGTMVLRDAAGLVVDSLNYGLLVDPWAAKGYQATSGAGQSGCKVPVPNTPGGFGPPGATVAVSANLSSGRFQDGLDTDTSCADFRTQAATTLPGGSAAGEINLKVASVSELNAGQTIVIDTGANAETAIISSVGTPGASTVGAATDAGATVIAVVSPMGFSAGQTISIDTNGSVETATIVAVTGGRGGARINLAAPLKFAHATGVQVSGTGVILSTALSKDHANGTQIATDVPTPGGPNRYYARHP